MSQHPEDLNVFKERLHAQIKEDLEPSILLAKQELLEKMKQCRDDKAKKQQCLQEYNDAVVVIDRAGKERFRDELLREKMRRNAGGWGTSPDRSQSRVGDFAMGGFASPAEAQEWNYESLFQQRSTPGLGHNRSRSQIGTCAIIQIMTYRARVINSPPQKGMMCSITTSPNHLVRVLPIK
jgi:hypothetical protein